MSYQGPYLSQNEGSNAASISSNNSLFSFTPGYSLAASRTNSIGALSVMPSSSPSSSSSSFEDAKRKSINSSFSSSFSPFCPRLVVVVVVVVVVARDVAFRWCWKRALRGSFGTRRRVVVFFLEVVVVFFDDDDDDEHLLSVL